jgi:hypothetical protein
MLGIQGLDDLRNQEPYGYRRRQGNLGSWGANEIEGILELLDSQGYRRCQGNLGSRGWDDLRNQESYGYRRC